MNYLILLLLLTSSIGFCKTERELISQFCSKNISSYPVQLNPKVLFLAGLPGAGKSTVKRILNDLGLISFSTYVSIDSDEFLVQLDAYLDLMKKGRPLEAVDSNQKTAVSIRAEAINCTKNRKLNFIYDTTLGGQGAVDDFFKFQVERYSPYILLVDVNPSEAWKRIKTREIEEGRTVNEEYFKAMTTKIPINISGIKAKNNLVITVDNTLMPPILKSVYFPGEGEKIYSIPIKKENLLQLRKIFEKIK